MTRGCAVKKLATPYRPGTQRRGLVNPPRLPTVLLALLYLVFRLLVEALFDRRL